MKMNQAKLILFVCALAFTIVISSALLPCCVKLHYCDKVTCENVDKVECEQDGKHEFRVKGGGICGCCNLCMELLGKFIRQISNTFINCLLIL